MQPKFTTPALAKVLKRHYQLNRQEFQIWFERGDWMNSSQMAPFPEECRGMLCGAKTRKGTRCKNDGTSYGNGRCKFHGGASTGPKTAKGKARSARNGVLAHR